jgi:hypothetical protein
LANTDETKIGPGGASHALCPTASAATDPLKLDTDGDGVTDRAECLLGTDPSSAASVPPRTPAGDTDRDGLTDVMESGLGTNPLKSDSDGDGLGDGLEVKYYATDPLKTDTDGDGCKDGQEVATVNNDRYVNSTDLAIVASGYGPSTGAKYAPTFDTNRDGSIGSADLGFLGKLFGPCT